MTLHSSFLLLTWNEAELDELGFHGDAGHAQPAGRFGLIAPGLRDGARE